LSFEVVEEHTNNLLGRREAKLVVHHQGAGTPDRLTVRKLASEHFKAPVDIVFVRSIATRTGGSSATCMVEIYTDEKAAGKKTEAKPAEKKEDAKAAPAKEAKPPAGKEAKPAAGKEDKPPAAKEAKPAKADSKPKA